MAIRALWLRPTTDPVGPSAKLDIATGFEAGASPELHFGILTKPDAATRLDAGASPVAAPQPAFGFLSSLFETIPCGDARLFCQDVTSHLLLIMFHAFFFAVFLFLHAGVHTFVLK